MAEKKSMTHEQQLERNAVTAADIMHDYFTGKIGGSDKIKMASISIGQFQRFRGTKTAADGLRFAIAKSVAKDREELKKILAR